MFKYSVMLCNPLQLLTEFFVDQLSPNKTMICNLDMLFSFCCFIILPSSLPTVAAYEATAPNQSYRGQESYDNPQYYKICIIILIIIADWIGLQNAAKTKIISDKFLCPYKAMLTLICCTGAPTALYMDALIELNRSSMILKYNRSHHKYGNIRIAKFLTLLLDLLI